MPGVVYQPKYYKEKLREFLGENETGPTASISPFKYYCGCALGGAAAGSVNFIFGPFQAVIWLLI